MPTNGIGAAAVGTADVPITGTFAQIDCSDSPVGTGASADTAFVASTNIWPQLGLAQTWLRPIAKRRSASQSLANFRLSGDG